MSIRIPLIELSALPHGFRRRIRIAGFVFLSISFVL